MAPLTAAADLGGARILLTGVTGFVGQALLERLLTDHPRLHVVCLVRPRGSSSGRDRLLRLARRPVFQAWREREGLGAVVEALSDRCEVVEGAVAELPALVEVSPPLLAGLDVVVHSASEVAFDGAVDSTFATNVLGVEALCSALLAASSDAHLVHVSTAYVAGSRPGRVLEQRLDHDLDWRTEARGAVDARHLVERESRTGAVVERHLRAARRERGAEGPSAVAARAESLRRHWVEDQLVRRGRERARSLGWADAYAHSKAVAERVVEELWAGSGRRLTVLRPSIIESALRHPAPGWIDGYKTADPLIIAYGRGQLPQFPGHPESVLDVVPVDFVVNAAVAAASRPPAVGSPSYLHVVTGSRNPLVLHRLHDELRTWFGQNPLHGEDGPVPAPSWRFPGADRLARSIEARSAVVATGSLLLGLSPRTPLVDAAVGAADRRRSALDVLRSYTRVYAPYVETRAVFDDTRALALNDGLGLAPGDRRGFRASDVDWTEYLQRVHLPAITAATRAGDRRPGPAARSGAGRRRPVAEPADVVVELGALVGRSSARGALQGLLTSALGGARGLPPVVARLLEPGAPWQGLDAEALRRALRRLRGVSAAELAEAARTSGAAAALLRGVDGSFLEVVRAHRSAGHRVVLVSALPAVLVDVLAHLVDEVRSTPLHQERGVLTGYLERPPLVGDALAAWVQGGTAGDRLRVDPARTYGYGSAAADGAWLRLVARPAAVAPDRGLRRLATEERWPAVPRRAAASAWSALLPDPGAAEPETVIDLRDPSRRVPLPHQSPREPQGSAGHADAAGPAGRGASPAAAAPAPPR